jgi:hypothetical protein
MNAQSYPPSFTDRLMDSVKRLPIPYPLAYFALFILESALLHVVAWVDGWLPAYRFSGLAVVYPLWLCGPLAIMTYLNSVSIEALTTFRPLVDIPDEMMHRLKYEFTHVPARRVIISGVAWSIMYLVFNYAAFDTLYVAYGFGTLSKVVSFSAGLVSFFTGSVIYYHTFRQLTLVNRTVRTVKVFDLFRLEPVYAFSALTSRTAITWVILISLTLLTFPIQAAPLPMFSLLIVQVVMAIAAFALPLRIVHSHLVSEKRRLKAELDQRVKATLKNFHQCLDDNVLVEMDQLNHAIAGLNAERDILGKIPTWPWRAGMLTGFLSIVVLPILLFLLQFLLARWLSN